MIYLVNAFSLNMIEGPVELKCYHCTKKNSIIAKARDEFD